MSLAIVASFSVWESVRENVVNLAMKKMRPVEHHLRLGCDLGVGDFDRGFLQRKIWRAHEELLRYEVVFVVLEQ